MKQIKNLVAYTQTVLLKIHSLGKVELSYEMV